MAEAAKPDGVTILRDNGRASHYGAAVADRPAFAPLYRRK
jgi:hypothetical protein